MKLLVVGDIGIIFTYEYITEIASNISHSCIDILSFAPRKKENLERETKLKELGCRIFYQPQYSLFKKNKLLHFFIRAGELLRYRVCRNYDTIHMHFPGKDAPAVCFWASKRTRIITSLYGSDLLRANAQGLKAIRKVLDRSAAVTVASRYIQEQVSEKFSACFDEKTRLVRYGSNAAATMSNVIAGTSKQECKKVFNFPQDRITILCGYNGGRAQRHLEILRELEKTAKATQQKVFLVLQCSYGFTEEYKHELLSALTASSLDGVIVTDFMQGEVLAKFRNSIDVFLNLQPTDVLSATMIEELEAGAIVVKGDWLCYPDLDERNIYMRSIPSMQVLSQTVENIVAAFSEEQVKATSNKGIWEILSWQDQFSRWKHIIVGE